MRCLALLLSLIHPTTFIMSLHHHIIWTYHHYSEAIIIEIQISSLMLREIKITSIWWTPSHACTGTTSRLPSHSCSLSISPSPLLLCISFYSPHTSSTISYNLHPHIHHTTHHLHTSYMLSYTLRLHAYHTDTLHTTPHTAGLLTN
jgi:hypothetical protein